MISTFSLFFGRNKKVYFWAQNDTPDLGSKSGAGNGYVHKNVIHALKIGNKASRPIGDCI